jgi:hypothetical protein
MISKPTIQNFFSKNKYFFILALLFLCCEILVNPTGDFPLNDDWTYTKSTLLLVNEGVVNIGVWPAMTLLTHLLWGAMFVKVFGFSFFILRVSTLVSSLIGLFLLHDLLSRLSNNKKIALIGTLTLLFNPVYFNLANTFLTDAGFNTLCIAGCYMVHNFLKSPGALKFIGIFIISLLLVFLRQFGLIMPLCFTIACLTLKEKKWNYFLIAIFFTSLIIVALKYYEGYLRTILWKESAYVYSGGVSLADSDFIKKLLIHMFQRFSTTVSYVFIFSMPFAIIFLKGLLKYYSTRVNIMLFVISLACMLCFLSEAKFPYGNIFNNMNLGPEVFYESCFKTKIHYYSKFFGNILYFVKYLFSSITFFIILLFVSQNRGRLTLKINSFIFFVIILSLAYIFMLYMADSFFDRYHILLNTLAIIIIAFIARERIGEFRYFILPLLFFIYISLAGTRDYFSMNRSRWEAYNHLRYEKKIPREKINGGFEINNWYDGEPAWWVNFCDLKNVEYLIQYKQEKGFEPYRSYIFQRYFPIRKDTIHIYERTVLNKSDTKR